MKALAAHIYAGGFTVGVKQHFDVLAHLEEGAYGVRSFKLNFPEIPAVVGHDRWAPYIKELNERHGRVEYMYANPPCAVWSVAGATMRKGANAWRSDPRLHCWTRCFDAFEQLRPKVYTCESVVRAFTAGREFMNELTQRANRLGYNVTHLLVDAQWLGVPQRRKRYFFVAHEVPLDWQSPNWAPPTTVNEALREVIDPGLISAIKDPIQRELVKDLPPKVAMRKLWEAIVPEEERVRTVYGISGRPRMFVHRVHGDQPMGTITGDYFIHPTEDRFLGIRELQVLNGFPPDYQFEGKSGQASLIARGVCPPVGEWLARNVRAALEEDKPKINRPSVRIVDLREPPDGTGEASLGL